MPIHKGVYTNRPGKINYLFKTQNITFNDKFDFSCVSEFSKTMSVYVFSFSH